MLLVSSCACSVLTTLSCCCNYEFYAKLVYNVWFAIFVYYWCDNTIIFVYYWCENRALNRATERRGTVLSDEKVLQREKVLQGDL